MTTTKPAWVTSDYGTSYEDLVKSWGHEIVDQEEFGSYQGDLIYILRDGDRHGLLVIGYGSCSGCDELEARQPWDDEGDWSGVIALADELRQDVHWEADKGALMAWVGAHPESHWWAYDNSIRQWLNGHGANLNTEEN